MARDLRPKHKLCRQFGEKLCDSPKCPVARRSYPAGQHGPDKRHSKLSGFGKQLREKQKVKRIYGILERQFSNYVAEASKKTGDTSKILLQYLESRLDNIVYRMGVAKSRSAARQMVSHGHVMVNGKKVNIPSYRVRVSDQIGFSTNIHKSKLMEGVSEAIGKKDIPGWLAVDVKTVSGKVLNTPTAENPNFDTNAIIGFYSR